MIELQFLPSINAIVLKVDEEDREWLSECVEKLGLKPQVLDGGLLINAAGLKDGLVIKLKIERAVAEKESK
jgi:hypothetical protein